MNDKKGLNTHVQNMKNVFNYSRKTKRKSNRSFFFNDYESKSTPLQKENNQNLKQSKSVLASYFRLFFKFYFYNLITIESELNGG